VPIIRQAARADAEAIAAVHVATWRHAYTGQIDQKVLDGLNLAEFTTRWQRNLSPQTKGSRATWVAEEQAKIVGFLAAGLSRDEGADKAAIGEIYALYVHPTAWNTGAGRLLMQEALAWLRKSGFGAVTLWVLTTNTRTRRFYEIAGLRPDGKVKTDNRIGVELHETRYRMQLQEK
jgi:GNAT superfamily N-acetyltransferase